MMLTSKHNEKMIAVIAMNANRNFSKRDIFHQAALQPVTSTFTSPQKVIQGTSSNLGNQAH
jgi:hypothetical protein